MGLGLAEHMAWAARESNMEGLAEVGGGKGEGGEHFCLESEVQRLRIKFLQPAPPREDGGRE